MFASVKLSTATLFAAILAIATVSATPLFVERAATTCKPNFEGNRQTIYHVSPNPNVTVNEWTADPLNGGPITLNERERLSAFALGEFLVPASGSPGSTYQFKLANDPVRKWILTVVDNGDVTFKSDIRPVDSQVFDIDCEVCPVPGSGQTIGPLARNCVVKHSATNKCFSGSLNGQTIRLAACDGSDDQKYIFRSGN